MSGNEPIRLDFGKKLEPVELKKDGGIQQSAFGKNEAALSIFKHYNVDKNVVLDESELQNFYKDLEEAAGKDKKLTAGEAVRFLKSMGIKNVKANEAQGIIKSFIDFIGGDKDMVEKTAMSQGHVNVTYKDGKEEFYMYDRDNKKSTLRLLKFSDGEGNHEVTLADDGKTKTEEVIIKDNTRTEIKYENGAISTKYFHKEYADGDVLIGKDLIPERTKIFTNEESKSGEVKQEFLDEKYGVLATREISPDGKTVIQKDAEGNETARFIMDESGEWKQTVTDRNGVKTVIEGDKQTTQFTETRTMEKTGGVVKLKDGDKEVALKYDEAGHVIAYAKEGETFKKTAERLGIDVNSDDYKEFCRLNEEAFKRKGSNGKQLGWFKIGEEVKLPTGFEAKLNVGEYEVDVKAEAAKYKKRVEQQSAPAANVLTPPAQDSNPPAQDSNPPAKGTNPPIADTNPPKQATLTIDFYRKRPEFAETSRFQKDGTVLCYDENGYISEVKDNKGNTLRDISRNADGTVDYYYDYEYDENNNNTRFIRRNADGTVDFYYDYEYDENNNKTRSIERNAVGTVGFYYDYKYDENNNNTRSILRNAVGTVDSYHDYKYDENNNNTRFIARNADGTVDYYDDYEYDENNNKTRFIARNADGTLYFYNDYK